MMRDGELKAWSASEASSPFLVGSGENALPDETAQTNGTERSN